MFLHGKPFLYIFQLSTVFRLRGGVHHQNVDSPCKTLPVLSIVRLLCHKICSLVAFGRYGLFLAVSQSNFALQVSETGLIVGFLLSPPAIIFPMVSVDTVRSASS